MTIKRDNWHNSLETVKVPTFEHHQLAQCNLVTLDPCHPILINESMEMTRIASSAWGVGWQGLW